MTNHSRRIVFLGTHGQYNIGDELLLETFLDQLGEGHDYVVNSYDPEFTRAQLGGRYRATVINTATQRGLLLKELLRCDVLCFGGGSIIKELYASTGRNRYATLMMILAIVTFTRLVARKPIFMLNIGVGPLRSPNARRLAQMILSQVTQVTVRDDRSAELCSDIGVAAVRVTDAVFSVKPATLLRGTGLAPSPVFDAGDGGRVRMALNLNFDIERPERWEPFLAGLAAALEKVNRRQPLELHALPMQSGFKANHDAEILEAFASRVPSIPCVQHTLRTPADVASVLTSCDVLVGERLHAVVMASLLGTPSFVLAYDVKVSEIAGILHLREWALDINSPFDADALGDRLMDFLARRQEIAGRLRERSAQLGDDANANFGVARTALMQAGRTG